MSAFIQVRGVPDHVHRQLKARAALAGMSMSDWILAELERSLARPTREELLARIAAAPAVEPGEDPATALRAEREGRSP